MGGLAWTGGASYNKAPGKFFRVKAILEGGSFLTRGRSFRLHVPYSANDAAQRPFKLLRGSGRCCLKCRSGAIRSVLCRTPVLCFPGPKRVAVGISRSIGVAAPRPCQIALYLMIITITQTDKRSAAASKKFRNTERQYHNAENTFRIVKNGGDGQMGC